MPIRKPTSTVSEIESDLIEKQKQELKAARKRKADYVAVQQQKHGYTKNDHLSKIMTSEDRMIEAVDFKRGMDKMLPLLEKLVEDKFDPGTFFAGMSKFAAAELASVAFTGEKEKNRLDALKHLLALGGHTATQKHEISRVDPGTEKAAMLSIIRGAAKDLQAEGIEIVDDSDTYE